MRISFLLPGRGYSGGVRSGVALAEALGDLGHDVQLLYLNGNNSTRTLARKFKNYLLQKRHKLPEDWVGQCKLIAKGVAAINEKVVGKGDVIISFGPDCIEQARHLPEECGKGVFSARGMTVRDLNIRQMAIESGWPIIAVSEYVKNEFQKLGADVRAVVGNGIRQDLYYPDDSVEPTGVGAVFGPGKAKDPRKVLAVFRALASRRPGLPLRCFGSVPRPEGLAHQVEYHWLPDLDIARKLYSSSQVWFCGSKSEGFGGPLLEAMCCGAVPVSSNCGGPEEFIQSGKNGLVLKEDSAEIMSEAICELLDAEDYRKQMRANALESVKQYRWHDAAVKMQEALEGIVLS